MKKEREKTIKKKNKIKNSQLTLSKRVINALSVPTQLLLSWKLSWH